MALNIAWSKRASKKFFKIVNKIESEFGYKVTSEFAKKVKPGDFVVGGKNIRIS